MASRKPSLERDLLDAARGLGHSLSQAAVWPNTGDVFEVKDDGVYELYCLARLVEALLGAGDYELRYVAGTGALRNIFAKAPANKTGRPRFDVVSNATGATLFQICHGTAIRDVDGVSRHPDISFQKGNATDDPDFSEVVMIWDAKFRVAETRRLTHSEVSYFILWAETLQTTNVPDNTVLLGALQGLHGNTLITNGRFSTETNDLLQRKDVQECEGFWGTSNGNVRP